MTARSAVKKVKLSPFSFAHPLSSFFPFKMRTEETAKRAVSDRVQTNGKSFKRDQYSTLSLSLSRLIVHSLRNNPGAATEQHGAHYSIDRNDSIEICITFSKPSASLHGGFKHEGGCRI